MANAKKELAQYKEQRTAIQKKLEEAKRQLEVVVGTHLPNAMKAVSSWQQDQIRLTALVQALEFSLDPALSTENAVPEREQPDGDGTEDS